MNNITTHVLVCTGAGCIASGSLEVSAQLRKKIKELKIQDEIEIIETGCLGPCAAGPLVVVYPDGVFYQKVDVNDVGDIVKEHLLKGRIVERLLYKEPLTRKSRTDLDKIDFFVQQKKIALRNCGLIDPRRIKEYIARDGYAALAQALTRMSPEQVIETVKKSGLRGRGGAGFPTGLKWEFTAKAKADKKFVLCNADEGDPGAFMDRSILEGDPHSIIEAMAIAAYAIGASQGYVYARAEYPLAVERLEFAINQAREYGLLGRNIMGKGFDFDLEIRMGSGAFVCGEETALMTSIEGNRGEPRPRPPFPANQGLWRKPSLLNNVETYANIPVIIIKGANWYASVGAEKSPGTKVFALAGAVVNSGLVEVPIGTPLGKIVFDIGGGVPGDKKFKAAQIGGPSGGCIPKEYLNVPLDYESLNELGAIMGSGGLIVVDEDTCMVDMARYFLDFVQDESCGKCSPCRIGTKRMLEIITRICEGKGEEADIDKLINLGNMIKDTALCGLGQTAPNPVLSTIRHFREEYEAHIRHKRCPAGVCPGLVRAPCQNACPAGVDVPGYISLIGEGRFKEAVILHRENNPFPGICSRVCPHVCETKCRRQTIDQPTGIRQIKRFMADEDKTLSLPEIKINLENKKKKIAIVGSGPAGLSCGYFLARLGYAPTIYEAAPKPGGMLLQGIPDYRLPRQVLNKEIGILKKLGVKIKTNVRLGEDITVRELRKTGAQIVFLGLGAHRGSGLNIPGEDKKGAVQAVDFLRDHNLGRKVKAGRKVVVIGGGNAAVDAARTVIRLGAEEVTILYRRTQAEMPAYKEEVEEAQKEGIKIKHLVSPIEITGDSKVEEIKCGQMALGDFDKSGRRRPISIPAKTFLLETDMVIPAVGQSADLTGIINNLDIKTDQRGFIEADPGTGQTSVPWIFAGGDIVSGPATVVEAIAGGERAAVGIDKLLSNKDNAFWREQKELDTAFDPDEDPVDYSRVKSKTLPLSCRKGNFKEIELCLSEKSARKEAKRCLRCEYKKIAPQ